MDKSNDIYYVRPAGRHLLTIGRDLIQDQYAAVVELVKNAYDADSPDVELTFKISQDRNNLTVTIADLGHGMSRDTVINKWLVPSTDDKFERKISPKGRIMQGRKGIGRYAASILGDTLLLDTVTEDGKRTEVLIEWKDFEKAEFLDDVEILVTTTQSDRPSGTILTITGGIGHISEWDDEQVNKLKFELKKLIPPISSDLIPNFKEDIFEIYLNLINFYSNQESRISEQIKPYPIFELYDYRISGGIDEDGKGDLIFENNKAKNTIIENIKFDNEKSTRCGNLFFDLRVYDRDKESIEVLINRGLKDEAGNYVGKNQARNLLNEYNGIGVYRNGFRIRPLGDPDFDWLELNKQRVQDPSRKIGSDQVIGYVLIEPEEQSHLEEKSARDGLRENQAYKSLRILARSVISELESRRFIYRQKVGLSRKAVKVEKEIKKLFSFDDLKNGIRSKLIKSGVSQKDADDIIEIISEKEQENNVIVEEIRRTVAIYQGQATLGKIVNVVLHEGRKPLNFFKNQLKNLDFWAKELKEEYSQDTLDEVLEIADGLGANSRLLVELFRRLDPLAAGKRGSKREFNIYKALNGATQVFENELIENKIVLKIDCPKELTLFGWENDIYVILTNLIDNSIYWITNKNVTKREIEISVGYNNGLDYIDYRDTGPGIEDYLIESEVIFDPEFSTKPEGTGLGLAIAGEAAIRNDLELKAFSSNTGAYFRLQPIEGLKND